MVKVVERNKVVEEKKNLLKFKECPTKTLLKLALNPDDSRFEGIYCIKVNGNTLVALDDFGYFHCDSSSVMLFEVMPEGFVYSIDIIQE